jgi:hypothetical protein
MYGATKDRRYIHAFIYARVQLTGLSPMVMVWPSQQILLITLGIASLGTSLAGPSLPPMPTEVWSHAPREGFKAIFLLERCSVKHCSKFVKGPGNMEKLEKAPVGRLYAKPYAARYIDQKFCNQQCACADT